MTLPEGYLKIGRPVNIVIAGESGTASYPSRVEDVLGDGSRLVLAYPMRNLVPVRLAAGNRVVVEIVGERGVYRLEAVVLGRNLGQVPVLVVEAAGDWVRHQRREFFRVALGMMPAQAVLVRPGASGAQEPPRVTVNLLLRDISGGGLGLVADRPLKVGDQLELELGLNGSGAFSVRVEVVWMRRRPVERGAGRSRFPFEAGAKFVDIELARREAIIRFCLRKQLKQRRSPEE
jgi:c-di-GMP-binding flagellar brake protein YcgR